MIEQIAAQVISIKDRIKYYESTRDKLTQANGDRLKISNKLTKTYIYIYI